MNKTLRILSLLAAMLVAAPVAAQQVQIHSVPIGKGAGVSGFGAAVPGTAGQPLVSQGALVDPAFGTIGNSAFTPGAANTVKGTLDGVNNTDIALPSCTAVNSAYRYTSGVGITCAPVSVTTGFDTPINFGLSASAAGNALTLNVTQRDGTAPSASGPVLVPFRSLTATAGTVAYSTISSALSLTIPNGATLGTANTVPFRVWIFLDANGGTPAIGVATCSNTTTIFPCASWEHTLKTSIAIGAGSGTAGVLYATAGVTSDAVRIVGFCDFANGLVTAGAWASSCTTLQVLSPGMKKPGDVVQTVQTYTTGVNSGSTVLPHDNTIPQITEGDQYMTQAVTPTSPVNLLNVHSEGVFASNANSQFITMALFQDATANALAATVTGQPTNGNEVRNVINFFGVANTAASTTFRIRAGGSLAGTTTFNGTAGAGIFGGTMNSFIKIDEIQG